jgi:hypothetical protein
MIIYNTEYQQAFFEIVSPISLIVIRFTNLSSHAVQGWLQFQTE